MKKYLIIILNVIAIFLFLGCTKKQQDLNAMEKHLNKNYSTFIEQYSQINKRIKELVKNNKEVLEPLIASDPKLAKTEFCYEFYGEKILKTQQSSTLLVFDFMQNTIALAYKNSNIDSIVYILENKEKVPMPIHFLKEEEFLNNQE